MNPPDAARRLPREVAWRVFAAEYSASTRELKKGEGEKIPTYVVSPLGAMINRMYIVGILTELQNIGTESEPLWRGLISDSTDKFYVYAGKYAPEATLALSRSSPLRSWPSLERVEHVLPTGRDDICLGET